MISAGRVLLMPKGEYNAATTYELLDLVSYQNSSYIAKGTTTGNLPTDSTYWQLSAYGGNIANLTGNFAEIEASTVAQSSHSIGDIFVDADSVLVRATSQISVGDTIAIGTNCEATTVEALINNMIDLFLKYEADKEISVQTDLNTLTNVGDYYKSSTSFYVTNAPTGIDSEPLSTFRLIVMKGSGAGNIVQTIISDDIKTYQRGYDGATWSSWVQLALSTDVSSLATRVSTAETDIDNLEASRLKTYASDSTAWDTAPTTSSTKPVTSGGIKTEIDKKLSTYAVDSTAWDTAPTASSTKPVTSGGVKDAIDTVNGNKANQTVIATRQANLTASKKYEIGDQFIYNNVLYKATAVINSGATITIGGNASAADNISTQISKITNSNYTFGSNVDLSSYTTYQSPYTAPSDGYLNVSAGYQASNQATAYMINTANSRIRVAQAYGDNNSAWAQTVFVKKGAKIYCTIAGSNAHCTFLPLATY